MTEHKRDMNITKIEKYKKAERNFYCGAQNRHEHYWNWQIQKAEHDRTQNRIQLPCGEPNNKHIQTQQRSNKAGNSPRKKVNENIQSTTEQYAYSTPVTKKSEELKTI